jgi:hypothetical protein
METCRVENLPVFKLKVVEVSGRKGAVSLEVIFDLAESFSLDQRRPLHGSVPGAAQEF